MSPLSEPGPRVRALVALMLRVGLGLSLLNRGMTRYMIQKRNTSNGSPFGSTMFAPDLSLFYHYLATAEMAIALALILGFFTAAAAVLTAMVTLLTPMV